MRIESRQRMAAGAGVLAVLVFGGQAMKPLKIEASGATGAHADAPTVAEARTFTENAEKRLLPLWIKSSRAQWVQETYITDDTEKISEDADQEVKAVTAELAAQ